MSCVVVTGSARGFGLCQLIKFKELGFNVVCTDINEEAMDKAIEKLNTINPNNTKAIKVICDVRKVQDLEHLFQEAKRAFGSVDIWINNAGVNQPDKPIYELSENEIEFMLDIDLKGAILGSKVAFKNMLSQGSGQIYNVEGYGSNDAVKTGLSIYGTTKRAVTYFTEALAKESEDLTQGKIKVCKLTPGIMITDFIKSANGGKTHIELPEQTKKVYNILGDYPETIVNYCVPRMIKNTRNGAKIVWLTNFRAFRRFMCAGFNKRNFFE